MPQYDLQRIAGLGLEKGVLVGKYRVERVLGAGGMGVVVAAHHLTLDEKVAIKFLLPEMVEDAVSASRFLREARAAVKIKSEHVARVFDVGTLESGAPYMVMEFLEGGDLAGWLRERGPLPIEQTIEFVLQACVAVAEAHRLGIVHRDLKPANLFCIRRPDGQLAIKVLDFGISKMTGVEGAVSGADTGPATLMGSPFYMSPEQMRSATDVDAGTDIWALGVLLHELLSGKVPFHGQTIAEVATKIAVEAPQPLRALRPEVPAGIEAAVLRCLEKNRKKRFASVGALATALLPFGPRHSAVYVERIMGTLDEAAASPRAWDWTPSSRRPNATAALDAAEGAGPPSGETIAPMGRTVPRGIRAKGGLVAIACALLVATVAAAMLQRSQHVVRVYSDSGSVSALPAPPAVVSIKELVEAEPTAPMSTRPASSAEARANGRSSSPGATSSPGSPGPASPPPGPAPAPAPRAKAPGADPRATTAPRRPGTPGPVSASAPAAPFPPSPSAPGAPKDCRLVSYFDSDGNQHFKQDCGGN
jgi:eukaryotic-like serine/threonine-protein kinase